MEFTLQSVEGVPDGSVLSIKIGETKRQGLASKLGQPFRFASSPAEPLPMKVEILTPAAPSQSMNIDPSKTNLVVDFGGRMKVTLAQRQAPELQRPLADVKDAAATRGLPADKLQTAQSAATYLEKHDLVRTFQDILHGLLVAKPEDPFAYLEDHVARAKALYQGTEMETRSAGKRPSRGAIASCSKVDALLDILQRTHKNLPLIMPYLPEELSDVLVSQELADECQKQFKNLDTSGTGKLGPAELIPVICQLSTANHSVINEEQCKKFIKLFDANEDGEIQVEEFTTLTQFVVIAAHLESPEGQKLLNSVKMQEDNFKEFIDILESDKNRINDVVPFLPDWLVVSLTSDEFMDDCEKRFAALDVDKSGILEPKELLPVVVGLTKGSPESIDEAKLMKFVKIFDTRNNNVITREEFIDFVQFLAVMNFLSNTVEGQQVSQASLDYANKGEVDKWIAKLKEEPWVGDVLVMLPGAIVNDISTPAFSAKCTESFKSLDTTNRGSLQPKLLFPLLMSLCSEHPIHIDDAMCQEFFGYFDKKKSGVVSGDDVVDFARFVVVIAYLVCCSQWHDKTVQHGKERIEELLAFLKSHAQKLDDVLPYLPQDFQEELRSSAFEQHCIADFKELDKDNSGVLEPKELIPFILQLSEGHHLALTYDHVLEFVSLFDTLKNGVLTVGEYINFTRFMMILTYLETEDGRAVAEAGDISAGVRQVEELLDMMQKDRHVIHKIVPLLPEDIYNQVTSDDFILACQARFKELDKDGNGTLEPVELFPIIVDLSAAHPYAIDMEHCKQFTAIFDVYGDGVIRSDEFVDFARFLCIMSYLHSDEGKQTMKDGLRIMESSREIDELVDILKKDRRDMRKVVPYLPENLRDELLSDVFASTCLEKFNSLDKDGNGSLDPEELYPLILEMTDAHHYALDMEQCKRFAAIFDDEKTGVISKKEFVNFARFLMVMSFLKTEDGKKTLAVASEAAQKKKEKREKSPQKALPAPDSSNAVALADHTRLDRDFFQSKADKLTRENETLRSQVFRMEDAIRQMENRMEEQEQRLRHAEIDLRASGGRLK